MCNWWTYVPQCQRWQELYTPPQLIFSHTHSCQSSPAWAGRNFTQSNISGFASRRPSRLSIPGPLPSAHEESKNLQIIGLEVTDWPLNATHKYADGLDTWPLHKKFCLERKLY